MRNILLAIITVLAVTTSYAQTDKHGNPVFNSVTLEEKTVDDYLLSVNYYTLKNNIENRGSSVYISDTPTLDQIELVAIDLPSDFFMIKKGQSVVNLVMMTNKPTRQYFAISPATYQNNVFPCALTGDISEHRAKELIKEQYDPAAKIVGGVLHFNNKKFTIIKHDVLEAQVIELIKKEGLSADTASGVLVLSEAEIKEIVLKESKDGGRFDFFTEIKGHEYDGLQVKDGVYTTKISIALYQWGRACFDIGVNTVENAIDYWAEHKGRPTNALEKEYITAGFNKEWER